MNIDIQSVEKKIGYEFTNKELLIRALTHSSYANEHKTSESYERLEFLGDAALNYIVGRYLYETFPTYDEGKLTKLRAGIVDRATVATVTEELELAKYLRTGAGDVGASLKGSVKTKCDLFEAVVGAIIVDCGGEMTAATEFVLDKLKNKATSVREDYKSELFELCARKGKRAEFVVTERRNDPKLAFCRVRLVIDGEEVASGEGRNTKLAEQDASKNYLSSLK